MKDTQTNNQEPSKTDREEQLSIAMKLGTRPHISDQRMDANRWQLKRKLRAQTSKKNSLVGRFSFTLATNKLQIAGMFLTFTFGFLLASNKTITDQSFNNENVQIVQGNKTEIIDSRDQMINFSIDQNRKLKSPLRVNYTTLRQTKLDTNFEDENTLLLLTSAMETDLNDSTRLELVEILKEHLENEQVRESLSFSLLNDPNPGVRMIVAESLAKLSSHQAVRRTLRQALARDTNQGVRVSVFEGLLENLDDETINLFKSRGSRDSNYYIRNKSQNIINEIRRKKELDNNSI